MNKKLFALIKPLLKPLLIASLVITLVLGQADGALAARSGGRIGGGSFRMPRSYNPAPSRTYAPPGGGYYPGGGIGFPFIVPIFGFGGGGLFTLLIFFAIATFLVRSFRSATQTDELGYESGSPTVSVARVQVGLLAEARGLQADLDRIATKADTSSSTGLAQVLQEATLSMLRHPEYWIYGGTESQQARLESAEAQFNRLALAERSKFTAETLSNVNNQLRQAPDKLALSEGAGQLAELNAPGEYIVVTLLVAAQGKLELPKVNNTQDLRQAISQIGSVSSDRLLAVEILWTPQAEGDTLSTEDMLVEYPDLKLV
ncbi:MAG: DUF1517 domain-containing protein [Cyanobacteria bacterium CRU_2_1]|nr:DUF1517 domain-containing protein [Cyanobacteria bacterium RU_5_0]NJR63298.1 DUF1517 domain-containing protein [Cyanobacteria bacterium CRU_2_1]